LRDIVKSVGALSYRINPFNAVPWPAKEQVACASSALPHQKEEIMRNILSVIVALGLAVTFVGPTFAAPKTKADCEKAHMKWDDTAKTCSKGSM
jgi:hypothetical protein